MNERGARIGWIGGGLGSLLFMLVFSVVWTVQGHYPGAAVALACFLAGMGALGWNAPWRFPETELRIVYLRFLAYYLAASVILVWVGFPEIREPGQWMTLARLAPMALVLMVPVFTLGTKTWQSLQCAE